MTTPSALFSHPALLKLHHDGYDPVILHKIETDLSMQATEMLMLGGNYSPTREDLISMVGNLMPRGDNILVLYKEAAQSHSTNDPENLTMLAEHVERVAADLESLGGRFLAARNSNLISADKFAKAQAAIGLRYADLMDTSKRIEAQGGPSSFINLNLISQDECPDGPLGAYYDMAIAQLATRPSMETYQRERATG